MNQVAYRVPTHIGRHSKQFSYPPRRGAQDLGTLKVNISKLIFQFVGLDSTVRTVALYLCHPVVCTFRASRLALRSV